MPGLRERNDETKKRSQAVNVRRVQDPHLTALFVVSDTSDCGGEDAILYRSGTASLCSEAPIFSTYIRSWERHTGYQTLGLTSEQQKSEQQSADRNSS